MTSRALHFVYTSSIAALVALVGASCSFAPGQPADQYPQRHSLPPVAATRIAQLGFGPSASYSVCIEPACPPITRKTMATARASVTLAPKTATTPLLPLQPAPVDTAPRTAVGSAAPAPGGSAGQDAPQLIVQFAPGSASLAPKARALIDQALPLIRQAQRIVVSGRTDSTGGSTVNRSLALARASSVRAYLRQRIPALNAPIEIDARGNCCFIAANNTPQGRQKNRRAEVVLGVSGQVTP
ncbi:MAG: OmpA family protein [Pseudomonadota bacterium]